MWASPANRARLPPYEQPLTFLFFTLILMLFNKIREAMFFDYNDVIAKLEWVYLNNTRSLKIA